MPRHRTQRSGTSATVSIHVRDVAQMFNSLDPSPFWDRDLDKDAAQFIEEEFGEKLSAGVWHLHVHTQEGAMLESDLQAAVEHYYERLVNSARLRLRDQMRIARIALLAGLGIFLASMSARGILKGLFHQVPQMLDEGFIILAWLALWRPAEMLLYEWVPLSRTRRLYQRLAGTRVQVRRLVTAPHVPERSDAAPTDARHRSGAAHRDSAEEHITRTKVPVA